MPRGLENYICGSEDRDHYNQVYDYDCYYRPPMPLKPNIIVSPIVNIESNISEEEIKQLINSRLQELKQNIVDEINATINVGITSQDVDAVIDEIYGGSASDVIKGE